MRERVTQIIGDDAAPFLEEVEMTIGAQGDAVDMADQHHSTSGSQARAVLEHSEDYRGDLLDHGLHQPGASFLVHDNVDGHADHQR